MIVIFLQVLKTLNWIKRSNCLSIKMSSKLYDGGCLNLERLFNSLLVPLLTQDAKNQILMVIEPKALALPL